MEKLKKNPTLLLKIIHSITIWKLRIQIKMWMNGLARNQDQLWAIQNSQIKIVMMLWINQAQEGNLVRKAHQDPEEELQL